MKITGGLKIIFKWAESLWRNVRFLSVSGPVWALSLITWPQISVTSVCVTPPATDGPTQR